MSTRVAERRRNQRRSAVYSAAILDEDGYVLASGRTSNMSEGGVFMIGDGQWCPQLNAKVILMLELPAAPTPRKPDKMRTVAYRARVVRTQEVGQLLGVGLELMEKVA